MQESETLVPLHEFVRGSHIRQFGHLRSQFHVPCIHLLTAVNGQVPAYGQAESLYRLPHVPFFPAIPDPQHSILHNILRLLPVARNAQSQSEKLVLQRQYIVSKTDLLHRSHK